MGIYNRIGPAQLELSAFTHPLFVHIHCHDIRQKHMVGTQFLYFCHPAFDAHRTFSNQRHRDLRCRLRRQSGLLPLIHVPSGTDTAVIRSIGQLLRGQVNNKFPGFFEHRIGMPFRTHGNICHRRIRADSSGPGYGNNIGIAFLICCRYHHRRNRINHISRFP